ncbi:helix-turn-helix transcriptional regulator [Microbacterium sp. E-13]|uniref:helix-turn-helix transcriptional regulator n=1 Tax=Microbacterium sp. E-13 TaxID=3404048 RepID=UPI003CF08B24
MSVTPIRGILSAAVSPFATVRARAKVLAREDRELRSELIRIRRELGLTQADIAERMGVSPQAVQKLERYDADPKLSTLRRYVNAVGALVQHDVSIDDGQSLALAASDAWTGTGYARRVIPTTVASAPAASAAIWSAESHRQSDFVLAAGH